MNEFDSDPRHVAVGDLNHDGYLDIVIANSGSHSIGIFFNFANGTFSSQIIYSTGPKSSPSSVAIGYFNNDSFLDIVLTDYAINSIGVFLNYGNGTFTNQILTFLGSSRPLSLTTAYFNDDNLTDIAVVNDGTFTVIILSSVGNGLFQIETNQHLGYDSIPQVVIATYFNQDTYIDLLIVNSGTSELIVLLNNPNSSFTIWKYSTGSMSHPTSLHIGDLNNDTFMDVVVANSATNNIGIFFGRTDGIVDNMIPLSIDDSFRPQSVVIIDFNNDTLLDILIIDSINKNLFIFNGYGNGSFELILKYSTGYNSNPSSFAIADFDIDNKLDVIVTDNQTNHILIFSSYEKYFETSPIRYPTGKGLVIYGMDLADFNNDGYQDIVVSNNGAGSLAIHLNLGNGTFEHKQTYDISIDYNMDFITTKDINNDGNMDIIFILNPACNVSMLLGNGDGTFHYGNSYSIGNGSNSFMFVVDDFNHDSYVDIITANSKTDDLGIFFGYGNGTFTNMMVFSNGTGFNPYLIVTGDIDNDQNLDLVLSAEEKDGIQLLMGNGDGSFQNAVLISTDNEHVRSLAIHDLNNDDRADLIYTNAEHSYVAILLSQTDGTFTNITKYPTIRGAIPSSIAFGYYNDDSFIDIAVSNTHDSSISIYFGFRNGSFEISNRIDTGYRTEPIFVRFTELNGDTQQDLVVYERVSIDILIFIVKQRVTFQRQTNYSTGSSSHPSSVVIAHFNGTQQIDLVVANSGNDQIEILFDYNQRSFTNKTILSTSSASHPQSLLIADFNRDHQLDIAVVNTETDEVNVFLGLGNGLFDSKQVYSTGIQSSPCALSSADFNRDNRTDLVVANEHADHLTVFLSLDYVTYQYDTLHVEGLRPQPSTVVTGDVNNDNHVDLAVVNVNIYSSSVFIYLGYGNGSFSNSIPVPIEFPSFPLTLALGDFNNDTFLDLVIGHLGISFIHVYLGYGNGSFYLKYTYTPTDVSEIFSMSINDLNNDGHLDIVAVIYNTNYICILQGQGDGSFIEQTRFLNTNVSKLRWVTGFDLNNDGFVDLVVANYLANEICILFGDHDGNFTNILTLSTGNNSRPTSIGIEDLNNDTIPDLVVANRGSDDVLIFFGLDNGTFSLPRVYLLDSNYDLLEVRLNDVNNDALIDILLVNYNASNSAIIILYGFGNGHFTSPVIYNTGVGSQPTSIAIADLNHDKKQDLVFTNSNQNTLGIMLQLKYVPFSTAASTKIYLSKKSQPKSLAIGDFNNDDQFDIVVANYGLHSVSVLLGDGDANFDKQINFYIDNNIPPSSVAIGHLDSDQYLDVAIVSSITNTIIILYGIGNGTLTNQTIFSTGSNSIPVSIAILDMNNDNYFDLIVANWGTNEILIYYGTKDAHFSVQQSYSVGYDARPQSLAIANMNNDDMFDIIVANYGTNYIEILLQIC